MHKRKPLVIIDTFHLLTAFTGIKTYTSILCEHTIRRDDLKATYISIPFWKRADNSTFLKGKLNFLQKIISHSGFIIWKLGVLPIVLLFKRADAVIAPDYVLPIRFNKCLGLTVFHDTLYWEYKENYNRLWRWYYTKMAEKLLGKYSVIVATSAYTRQKISSLISDTQPMSIIYQSFKPLNKMATSKSILDKFKVQPFKYFLHVGTFDKRKNLSTLIRAFKIFINKYGSRDYKLVLVGARGVAKNHDDYDVLVSTIKIENMEGQVILPGFVDNEELVSLYKYANAYVFPSIEEGFGIPILEAMSLDVPVIVSNKGSLQEIAGEAALVFDAKNADMLADQLHQIQQPEIRNTLIEKGKARVAKFSIEYFIQNFDELIYQQLNKK